MTWAEASRDAYLAAQSLKERPRSCISRAYYSAYSSVAGALEKAKGISFPSERAGPNHATLPKLIDKLKDMHENERRDVKAAIRRLYAARLDADYQPARVD